MPPSSVAPTVPFSPLNNVRVVCRTPLHYAAANGNSTCTVALVSTGADVNQPDSQGCTPLHYTAAAQAFCR